MPGLYSDQLPTLVRESLPHVFMVEFRDKAGAVIPLDVKTCEVTFDDTWWPYVQGSLTAVIPADQATLDRLDPRKFVKATVSAGYVLPDGTRDIQPLAVLYLSGRSVSRPNDEVTVSLQGQEFVLARAVSTTSPRAWDFNATFASAFNPSAATEVRDAVRWILAEIGGTLFGYNTGAAPGWDYDNASNAAGWSGTGSSGGVDLRYGANLPFPGAALLDVARDIANLTGCWLRCDETGVWRCTGPTSNRPAGDVSALWIPVVRLPPARAVLAVGAGGTVVESSTGFDRDDEWANMAVIRFTGNVNDASMTDTNTFGFARVTSGPFAVQSVGVVARVADEPAANQISRYMTRAQANDRAGYALSKYLRLGRSIQLGAVGMYWLRPGDGVAVQLPLGPQERHEISAVTYTLHEGRMSLRTVLPDTASGITIGGS